MRKLARISLAIGGFIIVTSLILTGAVLLILLGIVNVEIFTDRNSTFLLALVFLALGLLDFVAVVILQRR